VANICFFFVSVISFKILDLLFTPEPKSIRSHWIIHKFEWGSKTWGAELSVAGLKLSDREIGVGFSR
jgi:hypothetical protein